MALIITLALLVLITLAILIFFIRVTANRQIESGSTSHTEADILSRSVLSAITAELQHEMLANSTTTGSDTGSPPLYYVLQPATPQDIVPQRVLTAAVSAITPATDNKFNNLIKQSVNTSFAFTSKSAAPVSVIKAVAARTDTPSLDGRVVGVNRWSLPDLIGDSSGLSGFDSGSELPNWVLMTRAGVSSTVTVAQAKDKTLTNSNYVIGRFAYNIYDEGGLVDINAAGYPTSSGGGNNLAILKGTRAGLDLSQIPGIDTTANMNSVVAWRNAASKSGFIPASPNSLDWYVNFALQYGLPNGFLKPWSGASGGSSDQRFLSRQDLILYATSGQAGISTKALPYLTTFSRALDQPSYAPDPNRPKIVSNTAADNYAGNDSAGHDSDFNPALLSIRVTTTFTRNDGSTAVVGEPLLKKRFALNRLCWLTYQGPSSARSLTDPDMVALLNAGITPALIAQGTTANIQAYFGLTWDSTNHYWTYNHGITGSASQPIIGYLSKVRDAAREPDFFELLKASVNAGSIAKGATNPARVPSTQLDEVSDYVYDTKLDYAILQIGANIIDQFDTDGYPTRIRFNDGTKVTEFRGSENLPYFYRIRSNTSVAALPNPTPKNSIVSGVDPWTNSSSLTDCGFYVVFWLPEIWNPYDVNSALGNPRPTNFRIVADGAPLDADGNSLTGAYNTNQDYTQVNVPTDTSTPPKLKIPTGRHYSYDMDTTKTPASYNTSNPTATVSWQGDNTALTFTDNSGALFREPTLLTRPNIPAGSNLALGSNNLIKTLYQNSQLQQYWDSSGLGIKCINDPNNTGSAVPVLGFYFGQGPLCWVYTYATNGTSNVLTASENDAETSTTSASSAYTFRVQYSDATTPWTTYDEKYVDNLRESQTSMAALSQGSFAGISSSLGWYEFATSIDPRTRRFGNPGGGDRADLWASRINGAYELDTANYIFSSDRLDTSSGFGWWSSYKSSSGVPTSLDTAGMAEVGGWYPSPSTTWMPDVPSPPAMHYRPGLLSQNNPAVTSNNPSTLAQLTDSALSAEYYSDPDGVVRRAMAAFVPGGGSAPASTATGLPMASTVTKGSYTAAATQSQSRPIVLNRPFRSVAELGYVFSGTPWKNLSMFTPESGYSALLDVFTIQDTSRTDAIVTGKINLNTRQKPVLEAALNSAYTDALSAGAIISSTDAATLAGLLTQRTQSTATGKGPLENIADLVGRWVQSTAASKGGIDGSQSYDGFSADIGTVYASSPNMSNIERFRESPIRALADVGTARVWNLLIDVIVQTGRYPSSATTFDNFVVAGEQHYWLHVAIDRASGQVIDQQLEVVQE